MIYLKYSHKIFARYFANIFFALSSYQELFGNQRHGSNISFVNFKNA